MNEAGEVMDDVVTSVQLAADIISGTAAASQEQSAGIDQVNQAVGHMDEITQQNAALVEQAAAAAESLQGQAANLAHLVDTFKLTQMGRAVALRSAESSKWVAAPARARTGSFGAAARPRRLALAGSRNN